MLSREEYRAWKAEIDLADTAPAVETILTHLKSLMVHAADDYEAAHVLDLVNYCKGKHPWARAGLEQRVRGMYGKELSTRTFLEMFGFEPTSTELEAARKSIRQMAQINIGTHPRTGWLEAAKPKIGGDDDDP